MQKEVEHLGFLLAKDRIWPQPKQVEAMLQMEPPKNGKQLKMFLGMIDLCWGMWPRQSHVSAPLNELAGIKSDKDWKWEPTHQTSSLEAKEMLKKR